MPLVDIHIMYRQLTLECQMMNFYCLHVFPAVGGKVVGGVRAMQLNEYERVIVFIAY